MKSYTFIRFICIAWILGFSNVGYTAEILAAEIDRSGKNILLGVTHGGGCGDHDYSLKLKGCTESMPVQCHAELVHKHNDFCEAYLARTAVISLESVGLKGEYYSGGTLTILGSRGSNATVTLPGPLATDPGLSSRKLPWIQISMVSCLTHAGSRLEVFEVDRIITLLTKHGESDTYGIRGLDIKSLPEGYRSSYRLTDGSTLVIEFHGESMIGTGYFIELNGKTSPNFSCEQTF